jgi:hypothetical protein
MHEEIDIVVTGHTNWAVNCRLFGKVVTGAASQGASSPTSISRSVARGRTWSRPRSRSTRWIVEQTRMQGATVLPVEKAGDITALDREVQGVRGADRRTGDRGDDGTRSPAPRTRRVSRPSAT